MSKLDEFNLTELGVFIAGVFASLSAFMVVLFRSKCETINCCCFKCKRNVQAIIDEERLQMTGHTGRSPKENENKPELKLELNSERERNMTYI